MPFLTDEHVQDLLSTVDPHTRCLECGHHTAKDYCRTCDEFYWIHAPGCLMHESGHYGHRLTIVPFVEDRSKA
jgi:hypothetical protein